MFLLLYKPKLNSITIIEVEIGYHSDAKLCYFVVLSLFALFIVLGDPWQKEQEHTPILINQFFVSYPKKIIIITQKTK